MYQVDKAKKTLNKTCDIITSSIEKQTGFKADRDALMKDIVKVVKSHAGEESANTNSFEYNVAGDLIIAAYENYK